MKTIAERRAELWGEPKWDERVKMMAAHVPPTTSVIDLGSGARTLAKYLPKTCRYTAADIMPGPGVLPLSWDEQLYPVGQWDVAVLSGSLEYASYPTHVLFALRELAPLVLMSYEHGGTYKRRTINGFRNHLSKAGLVAELERAGWRHEEIGRWKTQVIYRLRRT